MTATESEPGTDEGDDHPSDGYPHTVPKSEVDHVFEWADHFEAGDTIRYTAPAFDEVQEAEVIGFSTAGVLSVPVIETPESVDADTITSRVPKNSWVPKDAEAVAAIELEYTQQINVKIPVEAIPDTDEEVLELVAEMDPNAVPNALPSTWDKAQEIGDLSVAELDEMDPTGGQADGGSR